MSPSRIALGRQTIDALTCGEHGLARQAQITRSHPAGQGSKLILEQPYIFHCHRRRILRQIDNGKAGRTKADTETPSEFLSGQFRNDFSNRHMPFFGKPLRRLNHIIFYR